MEMSRGHKKEVEAAKTEAKAVEVADAELRAKQAEAEIEARRFSKLCVTCDRRVLTERGLWLHSKVCKGARQSKATQEAVAVANNTFDSLKGRAVSMCTDSDFPVPQDEGYSMLQSLYMCLLSWQPKFDTLASEKYHTACAAVPASGWATKENCRRPPHSFATDVVAVMRHCFDVKPRLNNYQIQQQLKKKYSIGSKVLRITQISGWVTSEVKRRKDAAMAAAADVANMANEAANKGSEVDLSGVFEDHRDNALGCNLDGNFDAAVLSGWKRKWRSRLSESSHQQREVSMMQFEDQVSHKVRRAGAKKLKSGEKPAQRKSKQLQTGCKDAATAKATTTKETQTKPAGQVATKKSQTKSAAKAATKKSQTKSGAKAATKKTQTKSAAKAATKETRKRPEETPGLLPGQAWSNCCGSAIAKEELDSNGNCKDQSDASECKKRQQTRGKRRRVAPKR
jgi:hypothetical protein